MSVKEINLIIDEERKAIDRAKEEIETRRKNIETLTKGLSRCEQCGNYFPDQKEYRRHDTKEELETVFIDAGYGDDDELAMVTRFNTYLVCPVCQHWNKISSVKIGERDRRTRR